MSEKKLEPCPHCNCLAHVHMDCSIFAGAIYPGKMSSHGWRVECEGDCHSMTCWWHTEQEATDHWNMRVVEAAQREVMKEAARELGKMFVHTTPGLPRNTLSAVIRKLEGESDG